MLRNIYFWFALFLPYPHPKIESGQMFMHANHLAPTKQVCKILSLMVEPSSLDRTNVEWENPSSKGKFLFFGGIEKERKKRPVSYFSWP